MSRIIVDAHCHLESYKSIEIKDGWIPVTSGYSHSSNVKNAAIAKKYEIPFCLGIAPQSAIKEDISKLDSWVDEIKKHKPNAIGEIGLDFHWAKNAQDVEKEKIVLARMIELADEMNLPVVIHAREAAGKVLDALSEAGWKRGIMMHFFSGTLEEAERAVGMGALISICPMPGKERRKVINTLALENLLVETDSPYVVRTFYDVQKSIDYVAEVKNMDSGEVARATAGSAMRFFGIHR